MIVPHISFFDVKSGELANGSCMDIVKNHEGVLIIPEWLVMTRFYEEGKQSFLRWGSTEDPIEDYIKAVIEALEVKSVCYEGKTKGEEEQIKFNGRGYSGERCNPQYLITDKKNPLKASGIKELYSKYNKYYFISMGNKAGGHSGMERYLSLIFLRWIYKPKAIMAAHYLYCILREPKTVNGYLTSSGQIKHPDGRKFTVAEALMYCHYVLPDHFRTNGYFEMFKCIAKPISSLDEIKRLIGTNVSFHNCIPQLDIPKHLAESIMNESTAGGGGGLIVAVKTVLYLTKIEKYLSVKKTDYYESLLYDVRNSEFFTLNGRTRRAIESHLADDTAKFKKLIREK